MQQLQTYEVTFLGEAGTTLRAEFEDCEVIIGRGTTTLRTELPDSGALSGLMQRINGLGLDVIDVSLVASPPRRLPPEDALCWRAKRLRPGEIDAIDDRTHPAHEVLVTARS